MMKFTKENVAIARLMLDTADSESRSTGFSILVNVILHLERKGPSPLSFQGVKHSSTLNPHKIKLSDVLISEESFFKIVLYFLCLFTADLINIKNH